LIYRSKVIISIYPPARDITKTYDAKWKIAFGIEKRFNNNYSIETYERIKNHKF